jgi:hypothetical protein
MQSKVSQRRMILWHGATSRRRDGFEAVFEEGSANVILAIGWWCDWFFEAFHEPTEALQALVSFCHPLHVVQTQRDQLFGGGQGLPRSVARWKEATPALNDFFARPAVLPYAEPGARADAGDYQAPTSRRLRSSRFPQVLSIDD